jgi:hypothetical protein
MATYDSSPEVPRLNRLHDSKTLRAHSHTLSDSGFGLRTPRPDN